MPHFTSDIERTIAQHERLAAAFAAHETAAQRKQAHEIEQVAIEQERRNVCLRIFDTAVSDDSLATRRVVEWTWKRLGMTGPAPRVKRFARTIAPHLRGIVFPGLAPNEMFAREDAKGATLIHETVHLARPELSEREVREFTAELQEEGSLIVPLTPPPRREVVDWCY